MAYGASQLLRCLARRYQAGASLDELAPMAGCRASTLAARLREIGVTIRHPGRRAPPELSPACNTDKPRPRDNLAVSELQPTFSAEDYAHVAWLLRGNRNNDHVFEALLAADFDIIVAALDLAAGGLVYDPTSEFGLRQLKRGRKRS